jgi:hypothetical protein
VSSVNARLAEKEILIKKIESSHRVVATQLQHELDQARVVYLLFLCDLELIAFFRLSQLLQGSERKRRGLLMLLPN